MVKHSFIFTEGPHDQAVVSKMLICSGLNEIKKRQDVPAFWEKLMPTGYPKSGRLHFRLPIPSFLMGEDQSVLVYAGEGNSSLASYIHDLVSKNPEFQEEIHGVGIIVDADHKKPTDVGKPFCKLLLELYKRDGSLEIGQVSGGKPNLGVYVLPDNNSEGVLDTLLVECGNLAYSEHAQNAAKFLSSCSDEHKAHWGTFDKDKALVATITSILRPGMANTSSLKNDDWITPARCNELNKLENFRIFLEQLTK